MKHSIYRIYGREGHRQRAAFNNSSCIKSNEVIFSFNCCDYTGNPNYVDVVMLYDDDDDARKELCAQISDGFFENCNIGKIEFKGGNDIGNIY